jgi:hypothetical protein
MCPSFDDPDGPWNTAACQTVIHIVALIVR